MNILKQFYIQALCINDFIISLKHNFVFWSFRSWSDVLIKTQRLLQQHFYIKLFYSEEFIGRLFLIFTQIKYIEVILLLVEFLRTHKNML